MIRSCNIATCLFHLCRLRHPASRHVTSDVMNHLVMDVILSRLDYCNSLLAGLPWSTVAPVQRVLNATVRLVLGLSPRDHVSQVLTDLHWLPFSLSNPVQISTGDVYGAYRPDHVIHQRRCDTNQPGPNSSPPMLRAILKTGLGVVQCH